MSLYNLTLGRLWSVLELTGKADLKQLMKGGQYIQLGVYSLGDNCPDELKSLEVVSVIAITSHVFNIIVKE